MSDLISRKALLEVINSTMLAETDKGMLNTLILDMPTAYDVDKVVKESTRFMCNEVCEYNRCDSSDCYDVQGIEQIIRSGGVEKYGGAIE